MDLLILLGYFIVVGTPLALVAWLILKAWERWVQPTVYDAGDVVWSPTTLDKDSET